MCAGSIAEAGGVCSLQSKSKKKRKSAKKSTAAGEDAGAQADESTQEASNASMSQSFVEVTAPAPAEHTQQPKQQQQDKKPKQSLEGTEVEARWQSGNEWFSGRIVKVRFVCASPRMCLRLTVCVVVHSPLAQVHHDGSFMIDYDDGEKELKVHPSLVRLKGANTTLSGEPVGTATAAIAAARAEESKQEIESSVGKSFMGSIYEDVDERGEEYQLEVRDQADDDWQVVTAHKPSRTPAERKEQQVAQAHTSKNRKKREKKREHELLVRELQRQSTA